MPGESIQHLEQMLQDRERELSELRASRQAETERVKPLPKATGLIAGLALVVLGALCVLGPVGVILLSPPDVQEEFWVICGLRAPLPSAESRTSASEGGIGQAVAFFGMGLSTVSVIVGGGVILIVKSTRDRRRTAGANEQAAQRISAIDARLTHLTDDIESVRHGLAAVDSREPSEPPVAK